VPRDWCSAPSPTHQRRRTPNLKSRRQVHINGVLTKPETTQPRNSDTGLGLGNKVKNRVRVRVRSRVQIYGLVIVRLIVRVTVRVRVRVEG